MNLVSDLFANPPKDLAADPDRPSDQSGQRNLRTMKEEQRRNWIAAFRDENEAFDAANLTGKDLVRWKYQRYAKNYLRCVKGVDESVGRIMNYLEANGLADNTVVIY